MRSECLCEMSQAEMKPFRVTMVRRFQSAGIRAQVLWVPNRIYERWRLFLPDGREIFEAGLSQSEAFYFLQGLRFGLWSERNSGSSVLWTPDKRM